MVEKLVPNPSIKNKIEGIFKTTLQTVIKFVFIVYLSGGLSKYIKTKVLTNCFYLT